MRKTIIVTILQMEIASKSAEDSARHDFLNEGRKPPVISRLRHAIHGGRGIEWKLQYIAWKHRGTWGTSKTRLDRCHTVLGEEGDSLCARPVLADSREKRTVEIHSGQTTAVAWPLLILIGHVGCVNQCAFEKHVLVENRRSQWLCRIFCS